MLQFIIIYFIAQFVNVIFNTIRLIFTVKPKDTSFCLSYGFIRRTCVASDLT